jgi:hypothetical protein
MRLCCVNHIFGGKPMRLAIIGALSLGTLLSGCVSTNTRPLTMLSSNEQAARCVARTDMEDPNIGYGAINVTDRAPPAPQIMTYDPVTKTETHVSSDGTNYSFSAKNRREQTGVGIKGSTQAYSSGPKVCHENGPHDEIDPVIAAAVVAAGATATQ